MEDGAVKVIAAQEDTPADRAGIKSGDYITHNRWQVAVRRHAGRGGVRHARQGRHQDRADAGAPRPRQADRGRDHPRGDRPEAVKWEVKGGVGYININSFSESTGADTRAAIVAIDKSLGRKPLGYVVDLRENGGGLLTQAIAVSDAFLMRARSSRSAGASGTDVEHYYAKPGDDANGLPVIVLTDSGTALRQRDRRGRAPGPSPRDRDGRADLRQGFGPDPAAAFRRTPRWRLTTARYYTPSGRSVQEGGIEPDIKVPQLSDPDYKERPVFREADLRRHLINEIKADNAVLEEDVKDDPRFSATPDSLKKQRIDDFQLWVCAADDRAGGAGRPRSRR